MRKMGVAYDSLVQVLTVAGTVALVFMILSFVSRQRTPPKQRGALKKMPLLLPAFAFIIALILSYQILPLPISEYQGGNETRVVFPNERSAELQVREDAAHLLRALAEAHWPAQPRRKAASSAGPGLHLPCVLLVLPQRVQGQLQPALGGLANGFGQRC